jgi:leader peptidase (prepilin peptidase)/N-methyltransferase
VEHSPLFINLILIVTGLALGSFATALAHRVPIKKPMGGTARSACPNCNHVLKLVDLVPVLSWVSTGGKCRYCKKNISIAYPLTELGVLLACLIAYWVKGWSVDTAFIIAAVPFLAALFVIDLRYMILPNSLLIVLGALGAGKLLFHSIVLKDSPDIQMMINYTMDVAIFAAISWTLGFVTEKVLKKEALGMGDVKFFAVAGMWLGLSQLGWFCALSGFFGVLLAVIFRNTTKGGQFPFGPALIAALFILVLTDGSLF